MRLIKSLQKRSRKLKESWWALTDSFKFRRTDVDIAFIDLGSNLGQGFSFFAPFYVSPRTRFILFEPNPNCRESLVQLVEQDVSIWGEGSIEYRDEAASTRNGLVPFFGLDSSHGGKFSQGGSIDKNHNSIFYDSAAGAISQVKSIDFSQTLIDLKREGQVVIVKMDIEGAEYQLLDHLIETGTANIIDTLYLEFHSKYRSEPERSELVAKEIRLMRYLESSGVKVRLWH